LNRSLGKGNQQDVVLANLDVSLNPVIIGFYFESEASNLAQGFGSFDTGLKKKFNCPPLHKGKGLLV
jgi:hypothetical protein